MEDQSQLADRILDQVADAVIYANRSGEIIRWNRCYDESKPLFITDIGPIIEIVGKSDADPELGTELWNKKTIGAALEKMEIPKGRKALHPRSPEPRAPRPSPTDARLLHRPAGLSNADRRRHLI